MSRFKATRERKNSTQRLTWDYRGRMLYKTTSELIWNNKNMAEFGVYLEEIVANWLRSIQNVRLLNNIFVRKDYDDVN